MSSMIRYFLIACCVAPLAEAQFDVQWLTLTPGSGKLVNPDLVTNADLVANTDEKDFAIGDVDRDGWPDLAVGKKVPNSFPGPREGRLLLNRKGVLVDFTAQLASSSLTAGDHGFKEPLDCRDVEFGDLDGDGWLDLVSVQTDLLNNTTAAGKRITHPRIYMNLGEDAAGNWLGLRHEDARIPQLLTIPGNVNGVVRFNDCTLGDIDGDGDLDLYCVDSDTDETQHNEPPSLDLNDRLLVNDGHGFFSDATATHFAATGMWSSQFGTECAFHDMNGDGKLDIVKISTLTDSPNRTEVSYNDLLPAVAPNFPGGFDSIATIDSQTGQAYSMANADLNNDGRIDQMVGSEAFDHYEFNKSNDANGAAVWSSPLNFQWLTGSGDDGFVGQMYAVDYDLDGWNDAIITDVDIDLPGCTRRTKIYHNQGGTPGATNIVLREEAQMSGASGWKGAVGWLIANSKGGFDVANIDIDHDGDLDIVFGRCVGTDVWMNQTNPVVCQASVVPASLGTASLTVCGQPLWSNLLASLKIAGGPPNTAALLIAGHAPTTLPTFGGLVMYPITVGALLQLDATGTVTLSVAGGLGTAAGSEIFLQALLGPPGGRPNDITNIVRVEMHD